MTDLIDAPADPLQALLTEPYLDEPRPLFHWLRERHPVLAPRPGLAVLSRYEDAYQVVRDDRFRRPSLEQVASVMPTAPDHLSLRLMFGGVAFTNPPDLARLRRIITRELNLRRVNELAPTVRRYCDTLLTGVGERLRAGQTVDLHREYSREVARTVMADLMGIPEQDRDWLCGLVNEVLAIAEPVRTEEMLNQADAASEKLVAYLDELAEQRRRDPGDDLISAWTRPGEEVFTQRELSIMLWAMWLAGFETTTSGIDHGLLVLDRHPESRSWLTGDEERIGRFVDEVTRYEPQILVTAATWIATENIPLGAEVIPAGTDVRVLVGAVNHDPAVYADPDRFDPAREQVQNFSFYQGAHYCLGHALARMEMRVALSSVASALPAFALTGTPARRPSLNLRQFTGFPVSAV